MPRTPAKPTADETGASQPEAAAEVVASVPASPLAGTEASGMSMAQLTQAVADATAQSMANLMIQLRDPGAAGRIAATAEAQERRRAASDITDAKARAAIQAPGDTEAKQRYVVQTFPRTAPGSGSGAQGGLAWLIHDRVADQTVKTSLNVAPGQVWKAAEQKEAAQHAVDFFVRKVKVGVIPL